MSKIAGIARIKVNGELLESLPGAKLRLGGVKRKPKSGHRFYGFCEEVVHSEMECTIVWKNETPIETIRNFTDGVINFEADNGITYMMAMASIEEPPELSDGEGEVPLKFFGDVAEVS
jgi:hypothetical protein